MHFLPVLMLALAFADASGRGLPEGARGARELRRNSVWHPVHVSSTQIDVSADRKLLEITVRLFTDDLEQALGQNGTPVSVLHATVATVDSALSRYMGTRLQLGVNGTAMQRARLVGHERDDDATLVYLELPLAAPLTTMRVSQQVMLELFEDQTNLLHVKAGTVKRSALFRRGHERVELRF